MYNRLPNIIVPKDKNDSFSFIQIDLWIIITSIITVILLLGLGYGTTSSCSEENLLLHYLEIVSNYFFTIVVFYAVIKKAYFVAVMFFGIFLASTFYHICYQGDNLQCPSYCGWAINSLSDTDLSLAALSIPVLGFYHLPEVSATAETSGAVERILLVFIPVLIGGVYSDENEFLAGFDLTQIMIYVILAILAIGVFLYRIHFYNDDKIVIGKTIKSRIFLGLTITLGIVAFVIFGTEDLIGYQFSHAWWHILAGLSALFYLLYIDERILEDGDKSWIYVLQCEKNKYYVGKTTNLSLRLKAHFEGNGCIFTSSYKPLQLIEFHPLSHSFDEDTTVKIYMLKYGIDNVRGGSYSQIQLHRYQIALLQKEIHTAVNGCFKCGERGHVARTCTSSSATPSQTQMNRRDDSGFQDSVKDLSNYNEGNWAAIILFIFIFFIISLAVQRL